MGVFVMPGVYGPYAPYTVEQMLVMEHPFPVDTTSVKRNPVWSKDVWVDDTIEHLGLDEEDTLEILDLTFRDMSAQLISLGTDLKIDKWQQRRAGSQLKSS